MGVIGVILVASFAIDRIVAGLFFLLCYSPDLHPLVVENPPEGTPHDERASRTRRLIYALISDYRLEGVEGAEPMYRLAATILDHQQAPATELAALYHERWEIETAFDELKTHLRGERIVLRSKTPDLVRQEFYGLLMAHFAVRGLMHEAALDSGEDPDRLSFLHAVRVIRRQMAAFGAIPPSGPEGIS